MKQLARNPWIPALMVAVAVLGGCTDDDGAETRQSGSVVVIGPPPPAGGGSVSAVGSGCTTRGATTKTATASIEVGLDEYSVTPPAQVTAGVNRVVVKNFGERPHELVIARAPSVEQLPRAGGVVDEAALAAADAKVMRIAAFAPNTICEGTFELAPGDYVFFGNQPASAESNGRSEIDLGMAAKVTVR